MIRGLRKGDIVGVLAKGLRRLARSGAARPLRFATRGVLGRRGYDRLRLAVAERTSKIAPVDPLHPDIPSLIDQLDGAGLLAPGAASRLRAAALGIRVEAGRQTAAPDPVGTE